MICTQKKLKKDTRSNNCVPLSQKLAISPIKAIFTVFNVLYSVHVKFLYNSTILMELFILAVKLNVTKLLNSLSFLNSLKKIFKMARRSNLPLLFLPPTTYNPSYFKPEQFFQLMKLIGFIMLCNSQCAIYIIKAEDDIEYS